MAKTEGHLGLARPRADATVTLFPTVWSRSTKALGVPLTAKNLGLDPEKLGNVGYIALT
jgi:hypothetical protein